MILHTVDIRNKELVQEIIKNARYVFHMASVCLNYSFSYPEETWDVNVRGSFNVFKSAKEANVERLVFSSSASVYGDPLYLPIDENHPFQPITPYCISKLTGELMLKMKTLEDLDSIILRYFNVYGIGQHTDAYYTSVINVFIKSILKGISPTVFGDGSQSMDFINVKDIVLANLLALKNGKKGEAYNVGSGIETSIKSIANLILEIVGSDLKPEYKPEKYITVKRRCANIWKALNQLGFKAKSDLKEELGEIIEDVKTRPEAY